MWWRLRCPPPAARGSPAGWRAALLGVPGTRVPAALGARPPRRQAPPCPAVQYIRTYTVRSNRSSSFPRRGGWSSPRHWGWSRSLVRRAVTSHGGGWSVLRAVSLASSPPYPIFVQQKDVGLCASMETLPGTVWPPSPSPPQPPLPLTPLVLARATVRESGGMASLGAPPVPVSGPPLGGVCPRVERRPMPERFVGCSLRGGKPMDVVVAAAAAAVPAAAGMSCWRRVLPHPLLSCPGGRRTPYYRHTIPHHPSPRHCHGCPCPRPAVPPPLLFARVACQVMSPSRAR